MAHDISLKKLVEKGVSKSWVELPKGMLQFAWGRGLLDFDRFLWKIFLRKGNYTAWVISFQTQVYHNCLPSAHIFLIISAHTKVILFL